MQSTVKHLIPESIGQLEQRLIDSNKISEDLQQKNAVLVQKLHEVRLCYI